MFVIVRPDALTPRNSLWVSNRRVSTKRWNFTLCPESEHRWGSPEPSSAVSGYQRKLLIIFYYLIPALLCHSSVLGGWSEKQSEGWPLISIQHVSLARHQEPLNFCTAYGNIQRQHCHSEVTMLSFLQHNFLFQQQKLAFCLVHNFQTILA